MALAAGAEQVTAVEENLLIIEIMREAYGDFSRGLYSDPRVSVINESGRIFARQEVDMQFDLTVVALTDPHRPVTSGAYSLTEEYVYTVEAFEEYLRTLDDDGLLVITRWLQTPPSESARTFATVAMALDRSDRDATQHLVAFRSLRTMTILASARAFTDAELQTIRSFLIERGFDIVYLPGVQTDELNRFNVLPEASY
jgi:spermidine synthase